jgi:hypothetical protein
MALFAVIYVFGATTWQALGYGQWRGLFVAPTLYAAFGVLWWTIRMAGIAWTRFAASHPRVARVVDIVTYVLAWELRVQVDPNASENLRAWSSFLLLALYGSSFALRYGYVSTRTGIMLMVGIEAVTELTGIYLAYRAWKQPKGQGE